MPGPILTLLWPIMVVVAWIMVAFHSGLTALGLGTDSGAAWIGSIVGLVIVMRIVLIPLFVKQIKASRGLQLIQPQMQKLQAKYKGKTDPASRQAMQQEMMALYREAGTNPFASCLPILAQSPIFFALFQVLIALPALADGTYARDSIGPLTQELAASAESSTLFGAPLSATFMKAAEYGDAAMNVRIVTVILIVLMSVTTFTTQRQLTMKNMPAAALDNPMARQQRMLMYILPVIFAVSGINFPIGVLIYWFTTNLWSMGQQFYVIRRMPAPGSEAEAALKARKAKRATRHGTPVDVQDGPAEIETKPVSGQRVQPVRKDRQRPARPAQGGAATGSASGSGSGSPSASKRSGQASGGQPSKAQGSGTQGSGAKGGSGTQRPSGQGSSGQGSGAKQQRQPGQGQRTTASGQRTARPRPAGQGGSGKTSGGATGSGSTKASGATGGGSAGTPKASDSGGPQDS